MIAFTLPIIDGKPLEILDFKVDFLMSPPEIREQVIGTIEDCLSTHGDFIEVKYKDAVTEEGKLDIYICKLKAGKYRLHILGKIMGEEFRVEKVLFDTSFNCKGISRERVKHILLSSRNILKKYYLRANVQSIENHLQAFLVSA